MNGHKLSRLDENITDGEPTPRAPKLHKHIAAMHEAVRWMHEMHDEILNDKKSKKHVKRAHKRLERAHDKIMKRLNRA